MKITVPTTVLVLLLTASMVLSGAHVKDLMSVHGASAVQSGDQTATKVSDLHPHIDKQIHKMSSDTPQLDGRSLRLRDFKRLQFGGFRYWLGAWREQLSLLLG